MSTSIQEANAMHDYHAKPLTSDLGSPIGQNESEPIGQDHDLVEQTKGLNLNGNSRPPSMMNGGLETGTGHHHEAEHQTDGSIVSEPQQRPGLTDRPSRSYVKPIPIVTTYEPELPADNASVTNKRQSVSGGSIKGGSRAPSVHKAPSINQQTSTTKAPSIKKAPSTAGVVTANKAPSIKKTPSRANSVKAQSIRNSIAPTTNASVLEHQQDRSPVQQHHQSNGHMGLASGVAGLGAGAAVGDVVSHDRQRELQQPQPQQYNPDNRNSGGVSLRDSGPVGRGDRSTTFEDPHRSMSPRPRSQFGHRPEPQLMSVTEDRGEDRYDGRDSRAGVLGRSGTVMSRANTLGRNGTLSRNANGGVSGSRRGAFGRGAGASIGTQPEEVLGRDDIHSRAELSERILGESALKRLATMEKKDATRLAKVIKTEGKAEAKAVQGSIKELERLAKLQREAARAERKSQMRLTKWTSKEHKARLRFLKEKERYEKIEGELRNAENDYEERRDHAAGLTSQVAEKTQDLDDLRAQKAADDREREVKLLALKNPAHS